jgi:hypothetical protein
MQDFCFYDRCFFELSLSRAVDQSDSEDEMDSRIKTPPREEEKVI